MEELIRAVFDLCKFQLMKLIDTGDRSIDACIQVIIMTAIQICMKFVMDPSNKDYVYEYYRKWMYADGFISPDQMFDVYNVDKLRYNVVFSSKTFESIFKSKGIILYCQSDRSLSSNYTEVNSLHNEQNMGRACYLYNGIYVCAYYKRGYSYNDNMIYVASRSKDALKSCVALLEAESSKNSSNDKDLLKVYRWDPSCMSHRQSKGIINASITFDNFHSRYKPELLDILTRFKAGNLNSHIHGHRNANLGFLLSGAPGVGKTTFIKTVANFLGRSIFDINFKRDKLSRSSLEELLTGEDVEKYVFVLEEFDLIQNVVQRNYEKSNLHDHDTQRKSMIANIAKCTDKDTRDKLMDEYRKMSDDTITLESMLTILDGIIDVNGRIIIATTNNPEMIDPALKRPGRLGFNIRLPYFNRQEMITMFSQMLHPSPEDMKWLERQELPEEKWSPCELLQEMQVYTNFREYVDHIVRTEPPRLVI